jgi:hypothetical protein
MTSVPDDPVAPRAPLPESFTGERPPGPPSDDLSPSPEAFTDVSGRPQISDGRARCTRLAVCRDDGRATRRFFQTERIHIFCEFEVLDDIGVPFGAIEITNPGEALIHGKASYQAGVGLPPPVHAGDRITFHWAPELRVAAGDYFFTVHLAETDADSAELYLNGAMPYVEFSRSVRRHCRLEPAGSFEVARDLRGKLPHHGLVDLPGAASFRVLRAASPHRPVVRVTRNSGGSTDPAVFHVTHWKAGSQWIYKILRNCCPDRIVPPETEQAWRHLVEPGRVYPTVYMSKQQLDRLTLPHGATRFVVIRDLRDTLVSAYFSFKLSHPIIPGFSIALRNVLQNVDTERGLVYLMDHFLETCAAIQLSWLEASDELVLRYEDLLTNDLTLLESALLDHCRLPVTREKLREAVLAARFEVLTGGRARGHEDLTAHERKGVSGDWRNHFTSRVKRAFKARYGGLLVASGYEADLSW